jgi:hypothetical protein
VFRKIPHKKAIQRELVLPSGLTAPGDSGGQVVLSDTGEAVGMIAGGSRLRGSNSYIVQYAQDMQSLCRDVIHPTTTDVVIARNKEETHGDYVVHSGGLGRGINHNWYRYLACGLDQAASAKGEVVTDQWVPSKVWQNWQMP